MTDPLLEVCELSVDFTRGWARRRTDSPKAVDSVNLQVDIGETLALVGESGSGKTTTARCIVGLQRPTSGELRFDGTPLGQLSRRSGASRRGIQMVFQDPRSSLNPRMTVAAIINEVWRTHADLVPRNQRRGALNSLLADVGLDPDVSNRLPGALSGGQCQRVSIARSLAMEPRLLVCDEAVSALDVSVQSQILRLLKDIQQERSLALLFITHDLGVVRQVADKVAVMQRGKIVEDGEVDTVFESPTNPYTRELLDAALDLATTPDTSPTDR